MFGEDNFLACIAWEKRYTRSNNAKLFYSLKDSIVVYRKSDKIQVLREPRTDKSNAIYTNPDNDHRGPWTSSSYVNPATKSERPNLTYKIINPTTGELIEHPTHAWKYEPQEHERHVTEKRLWWGKSGDAKFPRLKNFLSEAEDGLVPIDLWDYKSTGTTDDGGAEFKNLFGAAYFDNPKPTTLVKRIVRFTSEPSDIILDFFAGSGTTGQAVMELNKEDGGNRKFILVQIPELTDDKSEAFKAGYKKISDITIERNKRVIDRITQEQTEKQQQGLFEQGQEPYQPGFKIYRLVKSHFPRVEFQPDPEQTAEENIALLKQYIVDKEATLYSLFNEADIFDEVMLKNGFQLSFSREALTEFTANSVYRVTDGHKTALVCLDPELNDTTVALLNGHDAIFICLERAVDTTKKWNLKHQLGEKLVAF
jgi:adenine-specific DNA-methyltransferase